MIVERQMFYSGRVQGVGFRYTIKQLATGYEVTGWVRNLADGRVELHARGEALELESFLVAITDGQLKQYIRQCEEGDDAQIGQEANSFEIRH